MGCLAVAGFSQEQPKGLSKKDKKEAKRERINALGSCMMTIMGIKARDMELDLTNVKIEVEKIMKADPRRIGGVNLTFHFPEGFTADDKQRVILERAAHTCPVIYSIHPDIEVKVDFRWPVVA